MPLAITGIDLLAILQKSLDQALFFTVLYARLDRVALEPLSLLCTFENSSECIITSFNSDSFLLKTMLHRTVYGQDLLTFTLVDYNYLNNSSKKIPLTRPNLTWERIPI